MARNPALRAVVRILRQAIEDQKNPRISLERRAFLKSSLAAGIAVSPLAHGLAFAKELPKIRGSDPVTILGGGISGLTTAYRLLQAGIPCEIFEGSVRLGGRIFTQDKFNTEGMFCELGGELIDSTHSDILQLAAELGVGVDDFRPGDAVVRTHEFYLNKMRYYDKELAAACGPLAKQLAIDMKAVFGDSYPDGSVTYDKHTPAAAKFDRMSIAEYLQSLKDVDAWVRSAIDIAYLGEYGLDTGEQSCINIMTMLKPDPEDFGIYGSSDESMRIRGGNSRIVEALAREVSQRANIRNDHRLVKIADSGGSFKLTFLSEGKPVTRSASQVICTLPFSVLREIEGLKELGFSPTKLKAIDSSGYGTNSKHMLGFRERVWRKPSGSTPPRSGYSFTDLPSQCFWDTSRLQPGESGILTNFLGGKAGLEPLNKRLELALNDCEQLVPGSKALYDGNVASFVWANNPFARGSYSCPRPGAYTTVGGSAKEPELGGRVLFAGEHVSEKYQGYMNGAVESGNRAAKTVIARRGRREQSYTVARSPQIRSS